MAEMIAGLEVDMNPDRRTRVIFLRADFLYEWEGAQDSMEIVANSHGYPFERTEPTRAAIDRYLRYFGERL